MDVFNRDYSIQFNFDANEEDQSFSELIRIMSLMNIYSDLNLEVAITHPYGHSHDMYTYRIYVN